MSVLFMGILFDGVSTESCIECKTHAHKYLKLPLVDITVIMSCFLYIFLQGGTLSSSHLFRNGFSQAKHPPFQTYIILINN